MADLPDLEDLPAIRFSFFLNDAPEQELQITMPVYMDVTDDQKAHSYLQALPHDQGT